MVMHYCDLHDDCNTCKLPFCPYEKLDDETYSGFADDDEDEDKIEDEEVSV